VRPAFVLTGVPLNPYGATCGHPTNAPPPVLPVVVVGADAGNEVAHRDKASNVCTQPGSARVCAISGRGVVR